ncbi:hypothetical protein [Nocardia sp. NPDC050793]|uniref:WXG100 family type VII secretion target n=1 Tax=Nocardia sp. NPDC050793 TaxID=3155159 RepID=UPI0033CD3B09
MREIPYQTERASHTRVDPAYAPSVEVFDNLTHQEIHGKVQLLDPAAIDAGRQAWQSSATGLTDSVAQAHNEIRSTIADGWRGGAAQTAADAVRDFEQRGQQLADVMAAVAQRLGQAGDAAETLRSAVGSPSGAAPDLAAALLDPNQATGNVVTQKATEHDRQDVVQAMDSIYADAFLRSGSGVPAFPDDAPVLPAGVAPGGTGPGTVPALPVIDTAQTPGVQPVSVLTATPVTAVEAARETEPQPERPPATDTTPATVTSAAGPVATPSGVDTLPAAAKTVPVAADSPAATAPSAPDRAPRPGVSAPVVTASTALPGATTPGSGAGSADDERKREERRKEANSEAVTGMGAGAVGGLMGGAIAAADTTRHGSSVASKAASARAEDEDDELHWVDDDLTFLEPPDETGELIGELDPTTPPVVGEWTELE